MLILQYKSLYVCIYTCKMLVNIYPLHLYCDTLKKSCHNRGHYYSFKSESGMDPGILLEGGALYWLLA